MLSTHLPTALPWVRSTLCQLQWFYTNTITKKLILARSMDFIAKIFLSVLKWETPKKNKKRGSLLSGPFFFLISDMTNDLEELPTTRRQEFCLGSLAPRIVLDSSIHQEVCQNTVLFTMLKRDWRLKIKRWVVSAGSYKVTVSVLQIVFYLTWVHCSEWKSLSAEQPGS